MMFNKNCTFTHPYCFRVLKSCWFNWIMLLCSSVLSSVNAFKWLTLACLLGLNCPVQDARQAETIIGKICLSLTLSGISMFSLHWLPQIGLSILKCKRLYSDVLSVSKTWANVKITCIECGLSGFRRRCYSLLQSARCPVLVESYRGTESTRQVCCFWKEKQVYPQKYHWERFFMLQRHPKPHIRYYLLYLAFPAL